jgi:hypothetical protein
MIKSSPAEQNDPTLSRVFRKEKKRKEKKRTEGNSQASLLQRRREARGY